jgi:hypothetical protein
VVAELAAVSIVLYASEIVLLTVVYALEAAATVVVAAGGPEGAEVDSAVELADAAACLLYFAVWCTIPSLLDSI